VATTMKQEAVVITTTKVVEEKDDMKDAILTCDVLLFVTTIGCSWSIVFLEALSVPSL
jgi:hypothetical protein